MSGAMRPVIAEEIAATAASRFREQYRDWADEDKFHDGKTKGEVIDFLNREQHTPENVRNILNAGWAYPECSSCGTYRHVVVQMQKDFGTDSYSMCRDCLDQAILLIKRFADAKVKVQP